MSLKSWIEEFYRIPAEDVPKLRSAEHSLQKWVGLLPENLRKHGVVYDGESVRGTGIEHGPIFDEAFPIDNRNCALCIKFGCGTCTLAKVRGGVECYEETREETADSGDPWSNRYRSVEPMIFWLKKAAAYEASLRQRSLTIRDVLVQAADTAQLCEETDPDKVWEFAFSTIRANEEDEGILPENFGQVVEDAYWEAEAGAKSYGMSVPDYILNVMYPSEALE